jgi:hypothetical protein
MSRGYRLGRISEVIFVVMTPQIDFELHQKLS